MNQNQDPKPTPRPPGPGTVLAHMFRYFLKNSPPNCACHQRTQLMNTMGNAWCRQNANLITHWLAEEATLWNIPFQQDPKIVTTLSRLLHRKTRLPTALTTPLALAIAHHFPHTILKRFVLLAIRKSERAYLACQAQKHASSRRGTY